MYTYLRTSQNNVNTAKMQVLSSWLLYIENIKKYYEHGNKKSVQYFLIIAALMQIAGEWCVKFSVVCLVVCPHNLKDPWSVKSSTSSPDSNYFPGSTGVAFDTGAPNKKSHFPSPHVQSPHRELRAGEGILSSAAQALP